MQKNLMVSGLGLTASLVAGMLRPMPSVAGETCNFLNRNLRMAQAAQNEQQVWVSEGWWVIEPGNCVTYADNVSTYFKDNAATRDLENAASKVTLCVVNDRFAIFQADSARSVWHGRWTDGDILESGHILGNSGNELSLQYFSWKIAQEVI